MTQEDPLLREGPASSSVENVFLLKIPCKEAHKKEKYEKHLEGAQAGNWRA